LNKPQDVLGWLHPPVPLHVPAATAELVMLAALSVQPADPHATWVPANSHAPVESQPVAPHGAAVGVQAAVQQLPGPPSTPQS
jgi:hypothetical protein